MKRAKTYSRKCIAEGCKRRVPWDQGSDYCAQCLRADARREVVDRYTIKHKREGLARPCGAWDIFHTIGGLQCGNCLAHNVPNSQKVTS